MAQIINITSEALQATIRRLLPSQQGFGEDLQATNVVTPIIDLTPTAEGSILPVELQQATAFGSATSFTHVTSSDVITNSGFFRVRGVVGVVGNVATSSAVIIRLNDGSTNKDMYNYTKNTTSSFNEFWLEPFDITVFLRPVDKLSVAITNSAYISGHYQQVADLNGNLTDPVGFSSE